MAFEYKRNRNQQTSETNSPKFTYTRDLQKRKEHKKQLADYERLLLEENVVKKQEQQKRLANFQSDNKSMDFLLTQKRDELKTLGANELKRLIDEYKAYQEREKYFLDMDIEAQTDVLNRYTGALDEIQQLEQIKNELESEKSRIEGTLSNEVADDFETNKDRKRVAELQKELEELFKQYNMVSSKYQLPQDYTFQQIKDETHKIRGDLAYAKFKQGGEKLTNDALSAEDFETLNAYGKDGFFRDDIIEDYIDTFRDLNMNWRWEENEFYAAMTDQEKKILGYYLAHGDNDSAAEYVNYLRETVGNKVAEQHRKDADTWYKKLGYGAISGLDQFRQGAQGIEDFFVGDESYKPASPIQQASGMIRQDIEDSEGFGNRLLGLGYDVVNTTTNMLPSIAVGLVNPTAAAVLMGTTAGGNAYTQMINEGYGWGQAAFYGTLVGASEASLEKILGVGNISKGLLSKVDKVSKAIAIHIGGEALGEFTEESLQTVLEPFFKSFVTGVDYEAPEFEEVLYSGLLGAITGGMFSGVGVAGKSLANTIIERAQNLDVYSQTGEAFLKGENAQSDIKTLIDNAQQSEDKKLQKAANKVSKTEKNGAYTASAKKVGKLATISEENRQRLIYDSAKYDNSTKREAIAKLEESGFDEKTAEKTFETLMRDIGENKVSKELSKAMEKNEAVKSLHESLANYYSKEAISDRMAKASESSPVTGVTQRIREASLKSAGIDVENNSDSKADANVEREDAVSIESVDEYGNYTVKTESGRSVEYNSSDISMSNATHRKLEYAKFFSINGAKAYFALAPDTESYKYNSQFNDIYQQGVTNKTFKQIKSDMPLEVQKAIYEAGKADFEASQKRRQKAEKDAKEKEAAFVKKQMGFKSDRVTVSDVALEKLKSAQAQAKGEQHKAAIEVIEGLAKMMQVNINIIASEADAEGRLVGPNGRYNRKTNTFTFDILSGMDNVSEISYTAMIKTAGHELTHFIQNWSPSKYIKLKNTTLNFLKKTRGEAWIETQIKNIMADNAEIGQKLTLEQAKDELVADAFENVLTEVDFAETVLRTDKGLFEKVHSWVKKNRKDFNKALKIATDEVGSQTRAGQTLKEAGSQARELYQAWADAFSTALENSTSQQTDVDGDVLNQARNVVDTPIIEVSANEELNTLINNSNKSKYSVIRDYLIDKFFGEKFVLSDGVKAVMDKSDAQELSHKADTKKTVALGNLREIIESAVLTASAEKASHKKFDAFRYYAVDIKYENDIYPLLLNVGRSKYTKEHHIYDITKNKRTANQSSTGLSRPVGNAIKSDSSTNMIPQESTSVKENISDTQNQARNRGRLDTDARRDLVDMITTKGFVEKRNADGKLVKQRVKLDDRKKLILNEYKRNINAYDAAETTWRVAKYHDDTDAIIAAGTAMQLRKDTIASIERTKEFAELVGQLNIPGISVEGGISEADLSKVSDIAYEAKKNLSEAEIAAITWARKLDVAGQKVYDSAMRRMRMENSQALTQVQNRIKQAIEKPNPRFSIPKGGKDIAEALQSAAKEISKLLKSKSTFAPEAETIELIKEAAIIGAGKDAANKSAHRPSVSVFESLGGKYRTEFKKIATLYEALQENEELALVYNPDTATALKEYVSTTPEESEVWSYIFDGVRLVRALTHDILSANTVIIANRSENLVELRKNLVNDFDNIAPKKIRKFLVNEASSILQTPKTFFHAVFGATETADKFYQIYNDGQNRYIDVILAARDVIAKVDEKYNKDQKKHLMSKDATIDLKMYDTNGNKIKVNEEHAISFVLAAKNADYRRHIMYGGMEIPDLEKLYKGENAYLDKVYTEHILNGKNENGQLIDYVTISRDGSTEIVPRIDFEAIAKKRAQIDEAIKKGELDEAIGIRVELALVNQEIRKIENDWHEKIVEAAGFVEKELSEYAKDVMRSIDYFYNKTSTEFLDQATMERYGYKKTMDKNHYYPIRVEKTQLETVELNSLVKQDTRVSALGMMKYRQKSKKACILFGAVSNFSSIVEDIAKYSGYLNTINYVNKVIGISFENAKKKDHNDINTDFITLSGHIDRALGNETFTNYINVLESDISGTKKTHTGVDTAIDYLNTAFIVNALAFNFSPQVKQLSALPLVYPDAGFTASVKGMLKGVATRGEAGGKRKIPIALNEAQKRYVAKYSKIYAYRAGGLLSVDLAQLKQSGNAVAKFMNKHSTLTGLDWMERTDAQALGLQFYAILEMVKKQNPSLSPAQAAEKAGKLLDETILNFQANYTVLQRAPLVRSKGSGGMQLIRITFGTFKSQQLTMLNAKIDSALKVFTLRNQINALEKAGAKENAAKISTLRAELKKANRYAIKIAAAEAVSYIFNAALAIGVMVAYRRKDEDDELLEEFGWDILESYLYVIPGLGDLTTFLVNQFADRGYYGDKLADVGLFGLINDAADVFGRIGEGELTFDRVVKGVSKLVAFAGIPARNIYNIVKAIFEWLGVEID